ncbi:amidohydrolase [Brachybacterium phenoliresistens]|uniref:Amidohydrolase n=1 Tax=Brachybacterium phenoliresistens TaxID=396014 RepID=Z9JUG6_9MICO|nr:amidohydrolase [Brachybacterium phenoliresistens]EWS81407.1 amidohydrolase [Brachybacterium phenoliresistens]
MATLFHHGSILTMTDQDERPESVLVRDGLIEHVGPLAEGRALLREGDEEVDLDGAALLPGFIDPHGHLLTHGMMAACVDLAEVRSIDEMVAALREELARRPDADADRALIGVRYDPALLAEHRHPTRHDLDRVSTTVPVFVLHRSVHMGVGSTETLRRSAITAELPDPEGGRFGREADGRTPDGYIEELSALAAVGRGLAVEGGGTALIPGLAIDPAEALRLAQQDYLRHGITTAQEGAADPAAVDALAAAAQAGALDLDVVAYPLMSHGGAGCFADHPELAGAYRGNLRLGGYKIILDGSPQARSAWMSSPYEPLEEGPVPADATAEAGADAAAEEPGACACGYPALRDEELAGYVDLAVEQGRQLIVHCNGDAAAEQWIRAWEQVLERDPAASRMRPVMIHAQTVRPDQILRMARADMIASIFAVHVYFWGDVHLRNLGPVRGRRISPTRTALDAGLRVTLHQDAPVTPPDMMLTIWAAVNRISREGRPIGLEQRISTWEALRAVTADAAHQYGEEDSKGTIRPGIRADLVVLDRDPLATAPEQLRDIRVLRTIKDGRTVHRA